MPDYTKFLGDTYKAVKAKLGDPPSGKYEDHIEEIKTLAPKLWEGSPEEQIAARRRFDEIKGSLSTKDAGSARDLASEIITSNAEASADGDLDSDQKKIMQNAIKTNLGLSGVKVATGLIQVIDSAFKKSKLSPPKFPDKLYKNEQLATQIAKTQIRAENGDQATRTNFEAGLADNKATSEARAKATGQIGSFSSLLQASGEQENDALRKFAAQEDQQKSGARRELNSLIGTSINEDMRIQGDAWKRFHSDKSDYVASINAVQQQANSGYGNIFNGLNEGAGSLPYAGLLNNGGNQAEVGGETSQPSEGADYNKFVPNKGPATPPLDSPRINNAQMMMLGNGAYRTKEAVERFQNSANKTGGFKDFTPGVWDEKTEAVYNLTMGLDPMGTSLNRNR